MQSDEKMMKPFFKFAIPIRHILISCALLSVVVSFQNCGRLEAEYFNSEEPLGVSEQSDCKQFNQDPPNSDKIGTNVRGLQISNCSFIISSSKDGSFITYFENGEWLQFEGDPSAYPVNISRGQQEVILTFQKYNELIIYRFDLDTKKLSTKNLLNDTACFHEGSFVRTNQGWIEVLRCPGTSTTSVGIFDNQFELIKIVPFESKNLSNVQFLQAQNGCFYAYGAEIENLTDGIKRHATIEKSCDQGNSWARVFKKISSCAIPECGSAITQMYEASGNLYSVLFDAENPAILKQEGSDWNTTNISIASLTYDILVSDSPSALFIASESDDRGFKIAKSTNGGDSWESTKFFKKRNFVKMIKLGNKFGVISSSAKFNFDYLD